MNMRKLTPALIGGLSSILLSYSAIAHESENHLELPEFTSSWHSPFMPINMTNGYVLYKGNDSTRVFAAYKRCKNQEGKLRKQEKPYFVFVEKTGKIHTDQDGDGEYTVRDPLPQEFTNLQEEWLKNQLMPPFSFHTILNYEQTCPKKRDKE